MTDNQEQLIKEAVKKALQGDMDAVNNIEDRVTRSKAKAALVKAKREAAKTSAEPSAEEKSEESGSESKPASQSPNQQFAGIIASQFPNTVDEELSSETHIQLRPAKWFDVAQYLRDDPACLFDSLQCITGVDLGEDSGLEVRYNLHSMTHRHAIEIRIRAQIKTQKYHRLKRFGVLEIGSNGKHTICLELNLKVTGTYVVSYCPMIGKVGHCARIMRSRKHTTVLWCRK